MKLVKQYEYPECTHCVDGEGTHFGLVTIVMPVGAQVITVASVDGVVTIFALVDSEETQTVERRFLRNHGYPVPHASRYICSMGVDHVFEYEGVHYTPPPVSTYD